MDLIQLIAANNTAQSQARALNARAGESVFRVMSYEEKMRWLSERLAGARNLKEVKDLQVVAFDQPEQEMVDLIMSENPDEIMILDKSLVVEYHHGCSPQVTLDREMVAAHAWRDLPDTGVRLPGGRLVEVVVPFGYYDKITHVDVPELKKRCMCKADDLAWDNWLGHKRPTITLPDPANPMATVAEIIECQYGYSVIDDTPLVAFGTVAVRPYYSYTSSFDYEGKWFRSREEAEAARAISIEKLEIFGKEAKIQAARAEAEAAREALRSIQRQQGWRHQDRALIARVENRCWEQIPNDLEEIKKWTSSTKKILAGAEAVLGRHSGATLGDLQNKFNKKR